jgi:mono/diheme cytochrome c family protein
VCHGESGRGDGPAAYLLRPAPRNFASATFRLVSTENGIPSDADLLATLRQGMPGSAMPPWDHLPGSDLVALVETVRRLMLDGKVEEYMADDDLTREEALAEVMDEFSASQPAVLPPPPPAGRIDLAAGQALYEKACAACHGSDGHARVPTDMRDGEGFPITARDFTRGIFKGGSSSADIALRIWLGMPGSPMPAMPLAQDELWSLVRYVEGMIEPGAQARVAQSRLVLHARRATGPLDADPAASAWDAAEPATWLAVMPLWWRDEHIEGLRVQALHDGERLALRVSWDDPTRDELVLGQQGFTDGLAAQFSRAADPPFFGMGAADEPVLIWHWKAAWELDARRGAPTLQDAHPGLPTGPLDAPGTPVDDVFRTAAAVGNALAPGQHAGTVERLSATGQGTLAPLPTVDGDVTARAVRTDGRWSVVLLRALPAAGAEGRTAAAAALPRPGSRASVAFAVWDGSAGDRNGTKSVTIWHDLQLED